MDEGINIHYVAVSVSISLPNFCREFRDLLLFYYK